MYYFADDASANPTFDADLRKPQSLNKYQYSYNNPLRWVDPDGHDANETEPDPDPPQGGQDAKKVPLIMGPGPTPTEAQQTVEALKQLWELPDPYLYPVSQAIGTAPDPTIAPVPVPDLKVPLPQTGTPPTQNRQPVPPPAPIQSKGEVKTATRTPGGVTPGKTVSDKQAANRLKSGGDIVSSSRAKARQVAKKASPGGQVVHHQPHRPGYRPHYHDKKHKNGHSFHD